MSYSHDDQAWVYDFWRALQEQTNYHIWLDRRLVPASDWWQTILQNIEECDCLVAVLTPHALESIFCAAELDYALALNKPILPLLLKQCDYPDKLNVKHIQYEFIGGMAMDRVLLRVTVALTELQMKIASGIYPSQYASRPDVPTPKPSQPDHIFEVFAMAEEAAAHGNPTLALELFHKVALSDPDGLGPVASQRMVEVRLDHDRGIAYSQVLRLANDPATRRGAVAAWQVYVKKYGLNYDPNGLAQLLSSYVRTSAIDTASFLAITPTPETPYPHPVPSKHTLPPPFGWCDIPAGRVTLEEGGYVPRGGLTMDVDPFQIGQYPVTVEQYSLFVQAGGYDKQEYWTTEGWNWRILKGIEKPRVWKEPNWHLPDHPIVGVSWFEAVAFGQWLSTITGETICLPTEQQWQRAAQGDDERLYPWGNMMDENRCNFSNITGHTTSVTQYPSGASPYGVVDMSGNVWEWCQTDGITGRQDHASANNRVLRGGAWDYRQVVATTTVRLNYFPSFRYTLVGFRLACLS
ncbi:MAG: SUMF1/EgtB/PvdO family nonheme iron enzyme [Anaerolineales bacterium]|nr:SUMF1/EgtB/PvdO family nonheme iron enzyme [Anaerolineales bacterium]